MNVARKLVAVYLISLFAVTVCNAQDEKRPDRGYLGVQFKKIEDGPGVEVVKTIDESPAADKLKSGDVILKLDDEKVTGLEQFRNLVLNRKPGEAVNLNLKREDKELRVEITLAKFPAKFDNPPGEDAGTDFRKVQFDSADGLQVTGDLYANENLKDAPFIVLCHQAGWSRGEYREIAPKLNKLGFNCLAIDQRSGAEVNDVVNETNQRAEADEKATTFVDAEQDMIAAVNWIREHHADGKVILWGSSYSAALAIRVAGEHPDLVDGVLAFAPGEYFARFDKPRDWITTSAKKINDPVFITSAKDEFPRWKAIFESIDSELRFKFVPETKGNHGSRALWDQFADSADYWKSVEGFLGRFK